MSLIQCNGLLDQWIWVRGSEPSERQEANEDEARKEAEMLRMLEPQFLTAIS